MALDGTDGLWMATEGTYDAIVLDLMLPGRNGFQICADLRESGDWTPILVLTAKDGDLDDGDHHKRTKENPAPAHGAEDTFAVSLSTWTRGILPLSKQLPAT